MVGTPEQNGFIERAGGVIIKVARALLIDANLPKTLWPLAVETAGYILNRTPTMLQDGQTVIPWVEAMSAKSEEQIRPNLANLRIYGCAAWVRDRHLAKKDKMASRARLGYLVGYVASNIWKIWFPATGVVRQEREVIFDETRRCPMRVYYTKICAYPHVYSFGDGSHWGDSYGRLRNMTLFKHIKTFFGGINQQGLQVA